MASNDKNNNGVPDLIERPGLPANTKKPAPPKAAPKPAGIGGVFHDLREWDLNNSRQFRNFLGDIGNFFTSKDNDPQGGGWGDRSFGPKPTPPNPAKTVGDWVHSLPLSKPKAPEVPAAQNTPAPDMRSAIQEAMEIIDSLGLGNSAVQALNYDPLREDARGRASDYDARLKAMYEQLATSISNDAAGIKSNFQGAIDQSAERSQGAQQSIQGASDAASDRNLQMLQALGIGEAAQGIVAQGRDLNSDTAGALQNVAQRGQITGDQLGTNQQASLSHNTNLVGVAGLEGNTQRARIGTELQQLLAQYDMAEQESRQQAEQANAQARQSALSQVLGLGSNLYGAEINEREYQDSLMRYILEQQQANSQPAPQFDQQSMDTFSGLLKEGYSVEDALKISQGAKNFSGLYR